MGSEQVHTDGESNRSFSCHRGEGQGGIGGRLEREGHQGTEAILDKSSAVNILALQMAGVAMSRVSSWRRDGQV